MKKVTSVLLLLCSIQFGFGQIISQYVETDSGTSPKGIEIWNNTDATLDFAVSNLVVEKGTNGGAPAEDITIDAGTLAPNAVMIIGTIDMESQAISNNVTFVEKSFTFNGNDALVIKYADVITDVFGEPGVDPGSNWSNNGVSTANQNIQLLSGINSGDLDGFTDPSERFETVSSTPSANGGIDGFGIAPHQTTVQVELSITEIFSGQSGSDLTADWFEIKNTSSVTYDASVHGDLYYDDESADATTADLVQDISTLAPDEVAIVLVTDNSADVTEFETVWNQVIDLTDVQIGYTDGSGLGGGGDAVNLWIGDPLTSQPIALGTYPDTEANDGQTYDLELGEFSSVDNTNAVATIAGGGDNGNVPNIGSPGNGAAIPVISITEIFSGQSGSDLTADWFEIKNISSVTYDASVHGDLYYDDESADETTADLVQDISTLAPGEIAIVLVTDNPADVTTFETVWNQVIDLTDVQIGYTDGSGLGGGGDAVNLWIGDPLTSQPIALGTYPDTDANDGQTYDLELGEFSTVDNTNAVATIAGGGDNSDVPNIGSPGNGNAVTQIFLDFSESYVSVQEDEGQVTVEVSLNEAASEDITFDVELLDGGSAENGNDFNFSTQNLSIAAGQTSTTFTVDITDNSNDTEDVFFVIQLTNILNAEMGSTNYHAIYILDDDNQAPTASEDILDISLLTSHLVDENGTAEITAFDEDTQRLFVVNNTQIEIIDFSDPANLVNSTSIDVTAFGASAQSVAINNGLVAIAVANSVETDNGFVLFTDTDGNNPQTVEVGALPDMLTFTPDGTKLLVANEGQPNANYSIDPEGSVSVIDVTGGLDNITQTDVQNLDFNAFDSELSTLLANDVRIFGPNATVSQDLEPEYIVVSENSERAYVSLQENNAYAVVDLVNSVVESIIPYGLKDHSLTENSLDVNDNIDFIFDATWPIKGMYMPDGIATYMVDGTTYIVTANEGDAREYDTYEEEVNLGDAGYELDPSVFTNAEILAMESNLAAINISNASGDSNDDGLFEEIHVYGGRSFSIYEAESGVQVYDSGNDFERIIAADPVYSEIFNASNSNNNYKNRSDNKGVEPEGVIVQEINDAMYAFVILERVGGVMVYDVTNPNAPQFIDYKNNRDATEGGEESGDLGPEGVLYIPADQNALDIGLLVISNEVSATVSVYAINNDTLGVNSFSPDNNEFTFYPNPVKSTLHLSASSDYTVYNLNGQLVKSVKDSSYVQVDDLQAGIYIIKSATGESHKFVKL